MKKNTRIEIFTITLVCLLTSCNVNPIKREKKWINQYHESVIDLKGDSLYFIPKSEIESTIGYKNLKPLKDVSIDDNVSFFDKDGNIVYQSTCVGISNDTIRVACFDLNKKVDYVAKITSNNYENIIDLKKFKIKEVKVFKAD